MKLNKIMLMFFVALPVSVGLRFLQLYFTIDGDTGFYINETKNYGPILLLLILFCALSVAAFSSLVFVKPEHPPKINISLSVSSLLLSCAILGELIFSRNMGVALWQAVLLKVFSIAIALYLILFAISPLIKFKLPNITASATVLFMVIKMICDFISISKLALISDNIFLIFSYCTVLLFFLNFTKLYCRAESDKSFKYLLSSGLTAVVLCFTNSVPGIIINIITKGGYIHSSVSTGITVFFFGVFILSFLLSHFSKKNLQ